MPHTVPTSHTPSTDAAVNAAIDAVVERAAIAAVGWAATPPRSRASALVGIAEALGVAGDELLAIAGEETGLSPARLSGELLRTRVQLRLFADSVLDGSWLDVRIDDADADFVLGVRPDIRRYRIPVGPVVNFGASNFPFAFSVAGGDSAAALAAGCPVILKAHSGHPRLSDRTGEVVIAALRAAGAPDGVFQVIHGKEAGVAALTHPRVAAGSFTGSIGVGRLLADLAAARPAPIPFYGELGSVNPVFVTAAALAERATAIAEGYVTSVSGSAGQLCTKPGFLFVPVGHDLAATIGASAGEVAEHRLLNPTIARGYQDRRNTVLATAGVSPIALGSLRLDHDDQGWATPTIVRVSAEDLLAAGADLFEESFGPLSIVVECANESDYVSLAEQAFEGNLTGTVHLAGGEDSAPVRALVNWITLHAGRVLFDGWPTGVAVTPAMQHGGPWPATTNDSSTSVGTAAIGRFLRPVAYQNAPEALLPEPLRRDNPWGVPQTHSRAGESQHWGAAAH